MAELSMAGWRAAAAWLFALSLAGAADVKPFVPVTPDAGDAGGASATSGLTLDASGDLPGMASPLVSVEMSASPASIALGDPCVVTITYRWPAAWPVRGDGPDPGPAFANEYITAAPPAVDARAGGQAQRTVQFTLCPWRSGPWELPRPAFTCDSPQGAVSARAPAVEVAVGMGAQEPTPPAPRPLRMRPPVAAPGTWWIYLAAGAVALVAIASVVALRQRRSIAMAITPWERLVTDLGHADRASDGKEAGALLSLALRRYAGAVWRFDGPGSTAREVAQMLRGRAPGDEARDLGRLLDGIDGLRWAAGDLPASAITTLSEDARAWTKRVQTRLDAEAAAAAAKGADKVGAKPAAAGATS